jgi:hypothetical protein
MADLSLSPILDRFERLTWRSGDHSLGEAACPGHDDKTNSLHIAIKDDSCGQPKILLRCLPGCDNGHILRTMWVGFAALFPDRGGTVGRPVTALSGAVWRPATAQGARAPHSAE